MQLYWLLCMLRGVYFSTSLSIKSKRMSSPARYRPWSSFSSQKGSCAPSIASLDWKDLQVDATELRPDFTLMMGQCFNWRPLHAPGAVSDSDNASDHVGWVGVLDGVAVAVRQTPGSTMFARLASLEPTPGSTDTKADLDADTAVEQHLRSYFQLQHSLNELYDVWGSSCPRMKRVLKCLPGVRVVRQDPFECLISFICSSNNNIKRITLMLDRLRRKYGVYLGSLVQKDCTMEKAAPPTWTYQRLLEEQARLREFDPSPATTVVDFFAFPSPQALATADIAELRALGLGYRDKFIKSSAQLVLDLGQEDWLNALRSLSDPMLVQKELMRLAGVGAKVADCVALFSLDQSAAIPVDTHVWDIAVRDYAPGLAAAKSLTPAVYEAVGDEFRGRFGEHAGWAHSVLFAGELPDFKPLLPMDLTQDMDDFTAMKRAERAVAKAEKSKNKAEKEAEKEKRQEQEVAAVKDCEQLSSRKRRIETHD